MAYNSEIFERIHLTDVLSWMISILLLSLAPFRMCRLYREDVKLVAHHWTYTKASLGVALAAIRVVSFVQYPGYSVRLAAQFAAALCLCRLSFVEHTRSVRPSTVITLYVSASLLEHVISSFSTPDISLLLIIQICIEVAVLVAESSSKTNTLKREHQHITPETLAGPINRAFFWWINAVIFDDKDSIISLDDLPHLDTSCSSSYLRQVVLHHWERRRKPESKFTLPRVLINAIRTPLLSAIPSRLSLIIFRYVQPALIEYAIDVVGITRDKSEWTATGRWIILATALVYSGTAISTSVYRHQLNRMKIMIRGSLIGLIHNKALSGNGVNSEKQNAKATTLLSTEVDSLATVAEMLHETWAQVLEVIVGMTLLTRKVGWISPILLISIYGCSRVSRYVAKHLQPKQRDWNDATQKRMAMTTSLVNEAKIIRMAGITGPMSGIVSLLRRVEIDISKKLRWIMVAYNASANALGIFSPVVILVLYTILANRDQEAKLDTNTAFTSIPLLAMVTHPANMIMTIVPRAVASQVGFERIQAFLLEPDLPDCRGSRTYSFKDPAVQLENATIHYSPDSPPILENIDTRIPQGSVTVCLGPVGAGKSTLIRAILGGVDLTTGSLKISTQRVALCMQTPWLANGNIRQAICGTSNDRNHDSEWYNEVIRACCLDIDLETLSHSDNTHIGHRGINLSGGQRQRVALARAIYSRYDILVLDDPFSALDKPTENRIVQNLLGPTGLLRQRRITTFIVTHAARHIHIADHVIVLENSKIKMQGPSNEFTPEMIQNGAISAGNDKDERKIIAIESEPKLHRQFVAINEASSDVQRKTGDLAVYRYYINAIGLANFRLVIACTASYSFFVIFPQYWLKRWTEDQDSRTLFYIGGYFLLSFMAWISTSCQMWATQLKVAPTSCAKLHEVLLRTTMGAATSFFFETDSAITINRFGQDLQLVDKDLPSALGTVGTQIFKLIVQAGLLFSVQIHLAATLPICIWVIYLVQKAYLRKARQLRFLELECQASLYSSFLETTEGITTIRAFEWQEEYAEQNCQRLNDFQRPSYILLCLQRWLNIVLDLLVAGLAVGLMALLVTFRGTATGAQVGIALNMVLVVNATLLRLVESWTSLETTLGAISRLKTFETETPQEALPTENLLPGTSWPGTGQISIQNVQVAYNAKTVAVQDCTLEIQGGQKVVICGRTGSGKSTILLALLRLLDLQNGSMEVDGFNLAHVPRNVVRERCFITVPQDPFIMPSLSLRFHLDPHDMFLDDQIIDCLGRARLWSHLSSRPMDGQRNTQTDKGTESKASDRNFLDQSLESLPPLSSGGTQLLSLARAALQSQHPGQMASEGKRRPILLIDEATSSLDPTTEQTAHELIDQCFTRKGFTVIMVTHRLDAVVKYLREDRDCVVWMENGRIQKVESAGSWLR